MCIRDSFAGRRKGLFLVLLIAPFWISYMMRMLAWIDLLQTDGYVNRALADLHLISQPVDWLGGKGITVIFGLVYGYIPYLILVLYACLLYTSTPPCRSSTGSPTSTRRA